MTFKFKIQKTPGALFWENVEEMLEDNKTTLKDVARYMRNGKDDRETKRIYDKLNRKRVEEINPLNNEAMDLHEFLLRFDDNLMFADLYSDWSKYDAKI